MPLLCMVRAGPGTIMLKTINQKEIDSIFTAMSLLLLNLKMGFIFNLVYLQKIKQYPRNIHSGLEKNYQINFLLLAEV
jgi:hypothetical protein